MARGHQTDAWNHTSEVLAMLAKCWLDGDWYPSDFHPDYIAARAAAPKPTNFNARYFAIRMCGTQAVEMFSRADEGQP